jgi:hypothetical protein
MSKLLVCLAIALLVAGCIPIGARGVQHVRRGYCRATALTPYRA